ncbi:MAG: O-antigen ligase family protein [Bacteroidales bacterium]
MNIIFQNNKYLRLILIIPLFIIPFLQTSLLLDTSLHIRFLALNIWLLSLTVFFVFIKKQLSFKLNIFLIVYLCYILYSLISVFISGNFPDAAYQFVMIANLGILVLLYSIYFQSFSFSDKDIALIFNILALVILFLTFKDYINTALTKGISHQSIYDIKASFSHKNILSEILFVLLPFSLYFILIDNKWFKLLGSINSIGILFFIIVLITRAVWIAVSLGFVITLLVFIIISGKKKIISLFQNKKTYILLFSFLIVIISSLIIYAKLDSFETIEKSTQKIFKTHDSSQHRIELWKRSIDISKENPFLGKGLGTWRIEVLKYGNRNLQSEDNITFYQRPHNDFLWILSEQGLLGLIFFLLILSIVFYYLIQIIRSKTSNDDILFYYLLFYLLTGYFIFSFFSFPRERIEHNLILGIIFSIITAKYQQLKNLQTKISFANKNFTQILVLICIFLLFSTQLAYSRFNAELHLRKAFEARSSNNWNKVINEINKSETPFYHIDPFSTPVKWYRGEAYFKLGNTNQAFIDYQKSYEINPYHIHVLNNLATLYEINSEHLKAIELYCKALQISPKFEDALLNLTAVYFNIGNLDSATALINKVDTFSQNEKYLPFLYAILKKRIENKIKTIDNKLIIEQLIGIKNNNDWMINIFRKSKIKCINFDKQLLNDCLFILKDINHTINETEFVKLKTKYIKIQ